MFQAPYQMQWRQHNLQIKQKPDIQLVFNFTYYHLLSFAINLRLDYLWQVIQETMNVQKNSVQKVFPQWGDWDILLGGFFLRSQIAALWMNICILELSILFLKIYYLYYMQVIGFWFFCEKSIFLKYFIVLL